MSDTAPGRLVSLDEIGTPQPVAPHEADAVSALIQRYALDEADRQLLAAVLGI